MARGVPASSGLLRQLSEEHALGREDTSAMRELAMDVALGRAPLDALLDRAEAYVKLHRAHSEIEDAQLLPLAQRILGTEAQARLRSQFAKIEGRYGSLAQAADALDVAFGPLDSPARRAGAARP